MPQQDKIKREIDRIGVVLAKLLGLLLNKPTHEDAAKHVMQQAYDELDIDLPSLLEMDNDAVTQYLVKEKRFSNEHLRTFGNLLYESASQTNDSLLQAKLKSKVLSIYEYINTHANGTVYLDVVYRIKELKTTV